MPEVLGTLPDRGAQWGLGKEHKRPLDRDWETGFCLPRQWDSQRGNIIRLFRKLLTTVQTVGLWPVSEDRRTVLGWVGQVLK